jgi:hypothetical protein
MSNYGLRLSVYCYLNNLPSGIEYAYVDTEDNIIWNNGGTAPTLVDLDAITTEQITAYQSRSGSTVSSSTSYTMAAAQSIDLGSESIVVVTGNGAGSVLLPSADNVGRSIEIFNACTSSFTIDAGSDVINNDGSTETLLVNNQIRLLNISSGNWISV